MKDNINNPAHYTAGGIECIDAIQAALTPEEFRGFCKGNIFKYCWRERQKGGNESVEKGEWYMKRLLAAKCDTLSAAQQDEERRSLVRATLEYAAQNCVHGEDAKWLRGLRASEVIESLETAK